MLSKFLTAQGFVVVTAGDGLEGIQKARATRPDLILMDLQLPRMDGLDVVTQLKGDALTRDIPIIFVSILPPDCAHLLVQETGVQGSIVKPFQVRELLELIQNTLCREEHPYSTASH
jgi:DNA-binding response OmpR family regulator